ncbi:MAG: ATP-grasp domain-containing protein [Gemmatimonadota bacterium]
MRIALATAAHLPQLADDDRILFRELIRRGLDAEPVVWDSAANWSDYDVIVTRSIWDYHLKYDRFLAWLDELDASGACICNPAALQRWNSDKHYMLDLAARAVRVTPTRVVERGDTRTLAALIGETGWSRVVVKPTVASSGFETWQLAAPPSAEDELRFARQKSALAMLVQEFAAGVREGERSFVFIGGEFTHCVLKRAASDEFRVHVEWGGSVERIEPPSDQVAWAQSVVAAVDQPWLYARVDAVPNERGELVVMELEMLEPELFFAYDEDAVERFIRAISE